MTPQLRIDIRDVGDRWEAKAYDMEAPGRPYIVLTEDTPSAALRALDPHVQYWTSLNQRRRT